MLLNGQGIQMAFASGIDLDDRVWGDSHFVGVYA